MSMEELATSILTFGLWPLLTLVVVALWVVGTLDIIHHGRGEAPTNVKSLCMATLVSAVAVIAIAGIGAVFGGQWFEAVARAGSDGIQTNEQAGDDSAGTYLFSFGLEHASNITPAKSTNAKQRAKRS
jgi:hypothetical protein